MKINISKSKKETNAVCITLNEDEMKLIYSCLANSEGGPWINTGTKEHLLRAMINKIKAFYS